VERHRRDAGVDEGRRLELYPGRREAGLVMASTGKVGSSTWVTGIMISMQASAPLG